VLVGIAPSHESCRESEDWLLAFEARNYLVSPTNVVATVRFCKHVPENLRRPQLVTFNSRVRANSHVLYSCQVADVSEIVNDVVKGRRITV